MSYFLRQTKTKKGPYLQIYFSFRDKATKTSRSKCIESLGYASELASSGIKDPIAWGKEKADQMNREWRAEKQENKGRLIRDESPVKNLGFFPLRSILKRMEVERYLDILQIERGFKYSVFECLSALIFARAVSPCSKKKTWEKVIPSLWGIETPSYDQILSCLEFCGENYEKIVEIFTSRTHETYFLNTSTVFFDCTNYYFEIDREDEFRRKGPSKENRKDPIVGMGLLLDANCIPIGMRLYPGNCSEKPLIRQVIKEMKQQQNISGRTVQVADKGLNCARNIIQALDAGDGYLFSKSVKRLPESEIAWILNPEGYTDVTDAEGVRYSYKSCVDKFSYSYTNEKGRKFVRTVTEKRLITYNPSLAEKQRIEIGKMVDKALNCCLCQAKRSEFGESSKYVHFVSVDEKGKRNGKKATTTLNHEKIDRDLKLCGYNLLVTSEISMGNEEIYNTYHQLWRIEESFRSLKSELDARPVFLQNTNRIKGHFLVCYLTLILETIFQFKMLENQFGTHQVYDFIRNFHVVALSAHEVLNVSQCSSVFRFMADKFYLPILNYQLSPLNIKKVLEF